MDFERFASPNWLSTTLSASSRSRKPPTNFIDEAIKVALRGVLRRRYEISGARLLIDTGKRDDIDRTARHDAFFAVVIDAVYMHTAITFGHDKEFAALPN